MKSLAILTVGALLGVAIMLFVPQGAPQIVYAGSPSGNGDVNGDGTIDLSDCIYTLLYLFNHGPAPEPVVCAPCDSCCPPPCEGVLPATGQVKCYDNDRNVIDCTSADFPGEDGFYHKGCPSEGRFVDNGDGTVTDNCTGLMWQKDTPAHVMWDEALRYCESLTLAGHGNWRLPNVRELQSIVDYGRYVPSIDPVFIVESGWYWSSSTVAYVPSLAWYVYFDIGFVYSGTKDSGNYVRAVRDAD